MSHLQTFLAEATEKAASQLEAALMNLPEDKQSWSAGGEARSALDMVAECALLNLTAADDIAKRAIADLDRAAYERQKVELCQNPEALRALLRESAIRVAQAILAATDADLEGDIPSPWGPMAATENASYPYWNMTYHEAQINFIASLLNGLNS